jgi:hypothetical protein
MAQLNLLSRFDARNAVLACRDTFLAEIVRETFVLAAFAPEILHSLDADIQAAGKQAKKIRLMDEIWREADLPRLPGFVEHIDPSDFDSVPAESFGLRDGRPRGCDAELLLVLLAVNGVESLTSATGYERLADSEVLRVLLDAKGLPMPKRSTVAKYLALVSPRTMKLVHKAQMRQVLAAGLDDLRRLTVDSSAVAANSAWPTESGLIAGHLERASRLLERQGKLSDVTWSSKLVARWLSKLDSWHTAISLVGSKRGAKAERKALYRKILRAAEQAHTKISAGAKACAERLEDVCLQPSHSLRVNAMMEQVDHSLAECAKAMSSAQCRIFEQKTVAAEHKAYSMCDPDAYMVEKGERDPVLGYKPQFGRSQHGFITCFEVERGNPADSTRLLAMVEQCVGHTGIALAEVSTDDGYTSTDNLDTLRQRGIGKVSFSGAKGRRVIGEELWNSEEYKELRDDRAAVESTIFTVKYKFNLRSFCRRGLPGVRMELAGTIFAYNLWRIAYVRRHKHEQESGVPLAA